MSSNRKEPLVPLSVAELLYVVLATAQQSGQLDARTKENVGLILATYRTRRDVSIKAQGFDDVDVQHYVAAAAEALANWLEDRAKKVDDQADTEDFAYFEEQLGEQQEETGDQGPDEYYSGNLITHNGTGSTESGTEDSEREADGGEDYPGVEEAESGDVP